MKQIRKRRLLLLILVLTLVFCGVGLFRHNLALPFRTGGLGSDPAGKIDARNVRTQPHAANVEMPESRDSKDKKEFLRVKKALAEAERESASEDVPVAFYGKVIDQSGAGVSGVRVQIALTAHDPQFLVSAYTGYGEKRQMYEITTDGEGLFTFSGKKGKFLRIEKISKEGYSVPPLLKEYHFSQKRSPHAAVHIPIPSDPVVFAIWKKGPTEFLIHDEAAFKFSLDNRVYSFDLVKGTKSLGEFDGDFWLQATNDVTRWAVRLQSINGGIVESKDTFLYRAPDAGYQPSYDVAIDSTVPEWRTSHTLSRNFFLKTRGGRNYIAMKMEFIRYNMKENAVRIEYWINTNGSPNLEPDFRKLITPK